MEKNLEEMESQIRFKQMITKLKNKKISKYSNNIK